MAISQSQLSVRYQPKVETHTGRVIGCESLARWSHPILGEISPEIFIPLAEKNGQIGKLTQFMLKTVAVQQKVWAAQGLHFPTAVNISASDLLDPHFCDDVASIMHLHGLAADQIAFEVTESAFISNADQARFTLQSLRSQGFSIYIDDFGTGFSSFSRLLSLPVNGLKIDKSFVQQITQDGKALIVIESILSMARKLGLESVAEGVESPNDLRLLQDLGCDVVQGYLISRPMEANDLTAWVCSRSHGIALQ